MKKHIVCFGDSNTHGYCGDPADSADHGGRFNEEERWTCLLQKALGEEYQICEEGLNCRTTVFDDPVKESVSGVDTILPILITHEPVDLLIIMLGTNDTKYRFAANEWVIGLGMERLVKKAKATECWGPKGPNILIVSPAPIGAGYNAMVLGEGLREKSLGLPAAYQLAAANTGCHFMDAAGCEVNTLDCLHLTAKGHRQLAERFAKLIPTLL